jgi:hypothetical protein
MLRLFYHQFTPKSKKSGILAHIFLLLSIFIQILKTRAFSLLRLEILPRRWPEVRMWKTASVPLSSTNSCQSNLGAGLGLNKLLRGG